MDYFVEGMVFWCPPPLPKQLKIKSFCQVVLLQDFFGPRWTIRCGEDKHYEDLLPRQ